VTSATFFVVSAIIGFSLILTGAAFGSAIGDGNVAAKAVESIARQPEARGNILSTMFLGVGVLEVFPIIGLGFALYLFFVIAKVPAMAASLGIH
jgi:F-type H+-transporting ATPase subunit c